MKIFVWPELFERRDDTLLDELYRETPWEPAVEDFFIDFDFWDDDWELG